MLESFILKVNDSDIYEFEKDSVAIISLPQGAYVFEFLEEFSYRTTTREIILSAGDSLSINFYSELNPIDN